MDQVYLGIFRKMFWKSTI